MGRQQVQPALQRITRDQYLAGRPTGHRRHVARQVEIGLGLATAVTPGTATTKQRPDLVTERHLRGLRFPRNRILGRGYRRRHQEDQCHQGVGSFEHLVTLHGKSKWCAADSRQERDQWLNRNSLEFNNAQNNSW